jgi:hypothetical protein
MATSWLGSMIGWRLLISPAFFPRLVQKAIWTFCANLGLDICNGNQIDDGEPCSQASCPLFSGCERLPLRATRVE